MRIYVLYFLFTLASCTVMHNVRQFSDIPENLVARIMYQSVDILSLQRFILCCKMTAQTFNSQLFPRNVIDRLVSSQYGDTVEFVSVLDTIYTLGIKQSRMAPDSMGMSKLIYFSTLRM